mmetsp:Transcript_17940/g.67645  ORF Transcript_17940/g.67645 Transcript_17940/m.67645 type:complete len:363 (-) Transcript_17940:2593-3681(-)
MPCSASCRARLAARPAPRPRLDSARVELRTPEGCLTTERTDAAPAESVASASSSDDVGTTRSESWAASTSAMTCAASTLADAAVISMNALSSARPPDVASRSSSDLTNLPVVGTSRPRSAPRMARCWYGAARPPLSHSKASASPPFISSSAAAQSRLSTPVTDAIAVACVLKRDWVVTPLEPDPWKTVEPSALAGTAIPMAAAEAAASARASDISERLTTSSTRLPSMDATAIATASRPPSRAALALAAWMARPGADTAGLGERIRPVMFSPLGQKRLPPFGWLSSKSHLCSVRLRLCIAAVVDSAPTCAGRSATLTRGLRIAPVNGSGSPWDSATTQATSAGPTLRCSSRDGTARIASDCS